MAAPPGGHMRGPWQVLGAACVLQLVWGPQHLSGVAVSCGWCGDLALQCYHL